MSRSLADFLDFLSHAQFRFYQERDLGLDLYHAGIPGVLLGMFFLASIVIFLLAIFHVIPERKHVVRLLLGAGVISLLLGLGSSYLNFRNLPTAEHRLIRPTAGPLPVNDAQRAAVVALPFVVGSVTLMGNTLGCLYMAIFWGTGAMSRKKTGKKK